MRAKNASNCYTIHHPHSVQWVKSNPSNRSWIIRRSGRRTRVQNLMSSVCRIRLPSPMQASRCGRMGFKQTAQASKPGLDLIPFPSSFFLTNSQRTLEESANREQNSSQTTPKIPIRTTEKLITHSPGNLRYTGIDTGRAAEIKTIPHGFICVERRGSVAKVLSRLSWVESSVGHRTIIRPQMSPWIWPTTFVNSWWGRQLFPVTLTRCELFI